MELNYKSIYKIEKSLFLFDDRIILKTRTRKLARSMNGKILYNTLIAMCYSKQNFLIEKY